MSNQTEISILQTSMKKCKRKNAEFLRMPNITLCHQQFEKLCLVLPLQKKSSEPFLKPNKQQKQKQDEKTVVSTSLKSSDARSLHSPMLSGRTTPFPESKFSGEFFCHFPVIVQSFSGSFSDWTICPPDFPARQSSGHDQKDQ